MQTNLSAAPTGYAGERRRAAIRNAPALLTPLINRERESAAACALLRLLDTRLLTLIGPGGVGKTRLALQIATELLDDFAGGVYFVSLASISDHALVIPTIARTLGLAGSADRSPDEQLKAYLQDRRLLLLIDNFEQVGAAAPLLVELLAGCPEVKLLVTARAVLHVRGEHEFPVSPLLLPDPRRLPDANSLSQYAATALFVQRALAIQPDFQVTDANAPIIAEICTRLDGLPLAIELAAARIKLLSLQGLLARLEHRLPLLTGGAQDLPARQQTLRNTIKWSYDPLDKHEQQLFRLLSVFAGGCTLEAVEAVCAASGNGMPHVLEGVASLLDKSQLQRIAQDGDEPRLLMLETIHEFGLELLAEHGEIEATRQAHAAYYLRLSEEAEPHLIGEEQGKWLRRLEWEGENLRAALGWLIEQAELGAGTEQAEMALRLGGALWGFWAVRGHWSEGLHWLERALAVGQGAAEVVRAKAFNAAGMLAYLQGDYERAEALCRESLALYREVAARSLEDPAFKRGTANSLMRLGQIARAQRDYVLARVLLEESLALSKQVGDKGSIADALLLLARTAINQGEYSLASSLLDEGLLLSREMADKWGIAMALFHLARATFAQGGPAQAHRLLEESLAIHRELDYEEGISYALRLMGQLVFQQSDDTTARPLLEESAAIFREAGDKGEVARSLLRLARVVAFQGDGEAARALFEESLALLQEVDDRAHIASCLDGLAGVMAAQGEPVRAVLLWSAVESLREVVGAPIPPVERPGYDRALAVVRAQLGEKVFAATWVAGRKMTPEQALVAQGRATMPLTLNRLRTGPLSAPTTPLYPAGLSAREVEVLRLIAEGMTSTQIAVQLVISPLTVNTHVRSIYSKLEVTSRSAATRYVIEHKLV